MYLCKSGKLRKTDRQKMEDQSENIENISIHDTLVNNLDIVRDKMDNVNNRINKAITDLTNQKHEWVKEELTKKITVLEAKCNKDDDEIKQLKKGNILLDKIINEKKSVIGSLELSIKHWLRRYEQMQIENADLSDKCSLLQDSLTKSEKEMEQQQKEIAVLQDEVRVLKMKLESNEQNMKLHPYEQQNKCKISSNIAQDNFVNVICTLSQVIGTLNKDLLQEKMEKEECLRNLQMKEVEVESLTRKVEFTREVEATVLRQNGRLKPAAQAETFIITQDKPFNISNSDATDSRHPSDNSSDYTQSTESSKMVSDLQRTINYKNSTISALQSEVISKESLMAELENKLLNMTKELQASKRNFYQLCDVKKSPSLGW